MRIISTEKFIFNAVTTFKNFKFQNFSFSKLVSKSGIERNII